jgi:hypothetical protein
MRWKGHVVLMEKMKNVYKIFVGKPEWKRPLRKPRWKDNIKMYLEEIRWDSVDWFRLTEHRDQ